LHQSVKWREELSPAARVQMVAYGSKHYYIYEPVTLKGPMQDIVIPVFFYMSNNTLYAKCITPKFFPLPPLQPGEKSGLAVLIPEDIIFNSINLNAIPVSQFDLTCMEMFTADGMYFLDHIRNHLVGESSLLIMLELLIMIEC
jgi:hypothetical protein